MKYDGIRLGLLNLFMMELFLMFFLFLLPLAFFELMIRGTGFPPPEVERYLLGTSYVDFISNDNMAISGGIANKSIQCLTVRWHIVFKGKTYVVERGSELGKFLDIKFEKLVEKRNARLQKGS